jgi:protein involved in polysaccharide export with SLBB domain
MKPAKSKATHLLAAAMTAVMLAGCSGYHPAPRAFHEAVMQPYRLDAGDRLRVTVFEQDGLTGTYTIDQSGYIAFPLIGAVPARGRTCRNWKATLQPASGRVTCAIRTSRSKSTATGRSTSWAKSDRRANIPMWPA